MPSKPTNRASELVKLRRMLNGILSALDYGCAEVRHFDRRLTDVEQRRAPGVQPGNEHKYLQSLGEPESQRRIVKRALP